MSVLLTVRVQWIRISATVVKIKNRSLTNQDKTTVHYFYSHPCLSSLVGQDIIVDLGNIVLMLFCMCCRPFIENGSG